MDAYDVARGARQRGEPRLARPELRELRVGDDEVVAGRRAARGRAVEAHAEGRAAGTRGRVRAVGPVRRARTGDEVAAFREDLGRRGDAGPDDRAHVEPPV